MNKLYKSLSVMIVVSLLMSIIGFATPNSFTQVVAASDGNIMLEKESEWKYLDNGSDQGIAWRGENFDDSGWSSGNGILGYGDPVTTELEYGPDSNNKYITTYYRTTFNIPNIEDIDNLKGYILYDDGAVVYINNQEVTRKNMPDGDTSYTTLAGPPDHEGDDYESFTIDSDVIKEGLNTVAVEVHQVNETSSDLRFDLSITSNEPIPDYEVSSIGLTPGANASEMRFSWYSVSDTDDVCVLQGALKEDMTGSEFPESASMSFPGTVKTAISGYQYNNVTVSGLPEGMDFVYRVGDGDGNWSDIHEFSTKNTSSYNFLVAGDPQIGSSRDIPNDTNGWIDTIDKSTDLFPDTSFILSVGDQVNTSSSEAEYEGFFAPEQLRNIPISTVIGNHDSSSANYTYHFNNPNVTSYGSTAAGSDYYYTYGDTLFMMLNSPNMNNADHDALMQEATEKYPHLRWRVVSFHHSIYSEASHIDDGDILTRRNTMPQLMDKYDVDVVLMGHDHSYSRSYQMLGNQPQKDQTIDDEGRVVNPTGTLYLTLNSASGSKYYGIKYPEKSIYTAIRNQERVPNMTNIEVTETTLKATTYQTDSMTTIDTYTIVKSADKEQLKETIINANKKNQSDYTVASWEIFISAFNEAKSVSDNVGATEQQVTSALTKLNSAMSNLTIKPATTNLENAIKKAENLLNEAKKGNEPGQYPQQSIDKLKSTIDEAKSIKSSPSSQGQVNESVETLNKAMDDFKQSIVTLASVIKDAKKGDTISVYSNENSVNVNSSALQSAKDKNITLKLEIGSDSLLIPSDAINVDGNSIKVTKEDVSDNHVGSKFTLTGKVFDLNFITIDDEGNEQVIHDFNGKVKVTIQLTSEDIHNINIDELAAYYYNSETDKWENLGGTLNENDLTFTFETAHFSQFAILAALDDDNSNTDTIDSSDNSGTDDDVSSSSNDTSGNPQTGDSSSISIYLLVLFVGITIMGMTYLRRRYNNNIIH